MHRQAHHIERPSGSGFLFEHCLVVRMTLAAAGRAVAHCLVRTTLAKQGDACKCSFSAAAAAAAAAALPVFRHLYPHVIRFEKRWLHFMRRFDCGDVLAAVALTASATVTAFLVADLH